MMGRKVTIFSHSILLPPPFNILLPSPSSSSSSSSSSPSDSDPDTDSPLYPPARKTSLLHLPHLLTKSIYSRLPSWPIANSQPPKRVPRGERGCSLPLFRPYVAKVPWHGGVRAFLSQLFPRYGHYCGPNWSSGKDNGSMLWDRRPIDWLDFCCYCHDIGYDTHDQAKLLKADLAFLECLERPRMATKGDPSAALLYRSMCIAGLRSILIPYRMQLVRLQARPSVVEMLGSLIGRCSHFKQNLDPKPSA